MIVELTKHKDLWESNFLLYLRLGVMPLTVREFSSLSLSFSTLTALLTPLVHPDKLASTDGDILLYFVFEDTNDKKYSQFLKFTIVLKYVCNFVTFIHKHTCDIFA